MSNELTPGLDLANSVKVYLDWNDEQGAWEVSPVTMDGAPLDTEHRVEGDLDRRYWTEADKAAADRADMADMPTGEQLIKLMAQYLPEQQQVAQTNAAIAVKLAAAGGSNDDEIQALKDYVAVLESILGYDYEETK